MNTIVRKNQVSDFFDELFNRDMPLFFDRITGFSIPAVNVSEGKEDFIIEVAAPGLAKDDFSIDLENNLLTISSEKETEDDVDRRQMRKEFNYGAFKRSFTLPLAADSTAISAKHENGILMITIPKKEEAKERPPRKIEIV